jgi:hypothetical protein
MEKVKVNLRDKRIEVFVEIPVNDLTPKPIV